jgi:hypothetical protein
MFQTLIQWAWLVHTGIKGVLLVAEKIIQNISEAKQEGNKAKQSKKLSRTKQSKT